MLLEVSNSFHYDEECRFWVTACKFLRKNFSFSQYFCGYKFCNVLSSREKKQLIGPPGSALMIISLVCKTERLIVRNCSLN